MTSPDSTTPTLNYGREAEGSSHRVFRVLAHLAAWYPILPVGIVYAEWLIARQILGRVPRPMLDAPMSIKGLESIHYFSSYCIAGTIPLLMAVVLLFPIYGLKDTQPPKTIIVHVVGYMLLWFSVLILFVLDPGRVFEWWFD
jgi:hypothetical protein